MSKPIYIVGDFHGEWSKLFDAIKHNNIENCTLICVGDVGMGFVSKEKTSRILHAQNIRFKKRSIDFISVRGNHDDPAYFDGSVKLSNIELLADYTQREYNGEKFLFIGGAISVDRMLRLDCISWWAGEEFIFDQSKISNCDTLITHSAPLWIGPTGKNGIEFYCKQDPTLYKELVSERKKLGDLIDAVQPTKHYCGHFHISAHASYNGCSSTILDIYEIKQHNFK